MFRVPQSQAIKGSQKWLRILINNYPDLIAVDFRAKAALPADLKIDWLSPIATEGYAEYYDKGFIKTLGVELKHEPLENFWPDGGPHWDGLGKSATGDLILIEAKAHIPEINSPATNAAGASLTLIQESLGRAKTFLESKSTTDWSKTYYQYTNRLAHLYLLRELNKLPAYMVNVYFVNDEERGGPTSIKAWQDKLKLLKAELGIEHTPLEKYCIDLFFDVKQFQKTAQEPTE